MTDRISIIDFFENKADFPLLDTRTPLEFEKGHIPGAINMPLFTNEERVSVGTTYKQIGREEAILLGFEICGKKWPGFIREALKISPRKKIALHCWRGGMRSSAMAWALDFYGFDVQIIDGGYKAYRRWVLNQFEIEYPVLVLGGMTGSHKTEILKELGKKAEQIIDLEGLAHHIGSSFGSMGKNEQPTQEQFENQLALELYKMDLNKKIWLEDESGSIGKVRIPRTLWKQMQSTEVIEVQTDNKERIDFLVDEYGPLNKDFLIESTLHIQKRLGSDHAKNAVEAIKENRMSDFIEIVLVYYDKAYRRCLAKRDEKSVHSLEIEYENPEKAAVQVLNFAKDKSLI